MNPTRICPKCAAPLPADAPQGHCPQCLLALALEAKPGDATRDALEQATQDSDSSTPKTNAPSVQFNTGDKVRYFGDYELLEEIARGGMGVVWKARQVSLNRTVALKMILSGSFASEAEVKRFRTEAEAAANLQHPNIVAIHEIGEHDGRHYFSMDYVAGKNLAERVKDGLLPPAKAAEYVKTLAEAIQYAHQRGILHRDLKPQNVLIDEFDQPRITDFGLAKQMKRDSNFTQTGAVMGSPSYMPPEQAAGQQDRIGPPSDVYALGAILYHLLTGRPPFVAETPMATMLKVLEEEPVPPKQHHPAVPPDLETICMKCLEKHSERRYATARGLAEELGRFLAGVPVLARPADAMRKAAVWGRKHPWFIAGILSFLVLGLLGLTYGLWEKTRYLEWKHGAVLIEERLSRLSEMARQPGQDTSALNQELAAVKQQIAAQMLKRTGAFPYEAGMVVFALMMLVGLFFVPRLGKRARTREREGKRPERVSVLFFGLFGLAAFALGILEAMLAIRANIWTNSALIPHGGVLPWVLLFWSVAWLAKRIVERRRRAEFESLLERAKASGWTDVNSSRMEAINHGLPPLWLVYLEGLAPILVGITMYVTWRSPVTTIIGGRGEIWTLFSAYVCCMAGVFSLREAIRQYRSAFHGESISQVFPGSDHFVFKELIEEAEARSRGDFVKVTWGFLFVLLAELGVFAVICIWTGWIGQMEFLVAAWLSWVASFFRMLCFGIVLSRFSVVGVKLVTVLLVIGMAAHGYQFPTLLTFIGVAFGLLGGSAFAVMIVSHAPGFPDDHRPWHQRLAAHFRAMRRNRVQSHGPQSDGGTPGVSGGADQRAQARAAAPRSFGGWMRENVFGICVVAGLAVDVLLGFKSTYKQGLTTGFCVLVGFMISPLIHSLAGRASSRIMRGAVFLLYPVALVAMAGLLAQRSEATPTLTLAFALLGFAAGAVAYHVTPLEIESGHVTDAQARHFEFYRNGRINAAGEGVPQNAVEAAKWFRKAAELGEAWSQMELALANLGGKGVEKDLVEASKWFRIAAKQDDPKVPPEERAFFDWVPVGGVAKVEPAVALRTTEAMMTPEQIAEARRRAEAFVPKQTA